MKSRSLSQNKNPPCGVSTMTVLRLISAGTIAARHVCKGAPWAIPEAQIEALDSELVPSGRALTRNLAQKVLDFQ